MQRRLLFFHSDEQEELEAQTENIEPEIWCNTKNKLPKQTVIITKPKPS